MRKHGEANMATEAQVPVVSQNTPRPPRACAGPGPLPSEERTRPPIVPAACCVCGEGVTARGCLIAVRWSTEAGGFVWANRNCAETNNITLRELPRQRKTQRISR